VFFVHSLVDFAILGQDAVGKKKWLWKMCLGPSTVRVAVAIAYSTNRRRDGENNAANLM
jgi:hypothetical protein